MGEMKDVQVLAPLTVMYLPFSLYPVVITGGISQQALLIEAMCLICRVNWSTWVSIEALKSVRFGLN